MAESPRNYGRVYHRTAKPRKGAARAFGESADFSDHQGCEALYTNKPLDLLKCLRPGQWVKNLLLLAAPFFAYIESSNSFTYRVKEYPWAELATLGFGVLVFIFLSGATYILNDLIDAKRDAKHPTKKTRPIAARKVSLAAVVSMMLVLLAGGLWMAWNLGGTCELWVNSYGCECEAHEGCDSVTLWHAFFWCAVLYVLLQPIYTFGARRIKDVGEIVLALGFVLRAFAGCVLANVLCTKIFLCCVFVAALFVVLCKRRSAHFIRSAPQPTAADARVLDIEIGIVASLTIATYAIYLFTGDCASGLTYTLPWVFLGIFRYLRLTYSDQKASTPEVALFCDPIMVICVLGWFVTCILCRLLQTPEFCC